MLLAATGAIALAAAAAAAPAMAQTMDHAQHMPGMRMPAPAATPRPAPRKAAKAPARKAVKPADRPAVRRPQAAPGGATDAACAPEHAAMGHCTPDAGASPAPPVADPDCPPEHAAMGHCTPKAPPPPDPSQPTGTGGTALAAGNAPAPAAPDADYADRVWGRDAMAPARDLLRREHGGMAFSQLIFNLAEVQFARGRDGYRWDGEFWYGGDIHRLTLKSEGEGSFGAPAGGEVQALYSRAIGPYFNLQAGVRQDVAPGADRTYATIGFEGLAPYWFDVEGALFLSDRGDVLGRLEGYYDQRITQRLILQPRVELNLSAQDVASAALGAGVTDAEAGLRLRYEIAREFAPYLGVSWERQFGDTARYARGAGEDTGGFALVAGIRTWF
ncbi:copper resistance protein B [Sphingomonas silueang]|uniref:copper resistance protein B n=1 Tax=Sphingomonas silueang TaxID=3156617 RepID=UPI003CCDE634